MFALLLSEEILVWAEKELDKGQKTKKFKTQKSILQKITK
jgi:hypothetical protein